MLRKRLLICGIYVISALILYTILFLGFVALNRQNKATPALAAGFFYGRAVLMQAVPIGIATTCFISLFKQLSSSTPRVIAVFISLIIGLLAYGVGLLAAMQGFIYLDNALDRSLK